MRFIRRKNQELRFDLLHLPANIASVGGPLLSGLSWYEGISVPVFDAMMKAEGETATILDNLQSDVVLDLGVERSRTLPTNEASKGSHAESRATTPRLEAYAQDVFFNYAALAGASRDDLAPRPTRHVGGLVHNEVRDAEPAFLSFGYPVKSFQQASIFASMLPPVLGLLTERHFEMPGTRFASPGSREALELQPAEIDVLVPPFEQKLLPEAVSLSSVVASTPYSLPQMIAGTPAPKLFPRPASTAKPEVELIPATAPETHAAESPPGRAHSTGRVLYFFPTCAIANFFV
eukprot:424894-Pleurochrysis_carterae.AAC.1